MKYVSLIILLLFLCPVVSAATIHGSVYDELLKVRTGSVVEVNSEPKQRFVSTDGTYSLNLPNGNYILTASYNGLKTEEVLTINADGDYVLDLFLFADFGEEDELISGVEFENLYEDEDSSYFWVIFAVSLAIVFSLVFFFVKKKKVVKVDEDVEPDELAEKIIEFLKVNDGRVTQKQVRKNFPLSEAKISLVISELEHNGKIRKIKAGRGNIINLIR